MPTHDTIRTSSIEREFFADEVAIDFLPLAAVVDRMRAAFFGLDEEPRSPRPRASRRTHGLGGRSDP
jgi:hypothetical protein